MEREVKQGGKPSTRDRNLVDAMLKDFVEFCEGKMNPKLMTTQIFPKCESLKIMPGLKIEDLDD
jgi:hypothetical protein